MRTTLNIDDDVLQAAKEVAAKEKRTAGQVISDLARKALNPPTSVTGTSLRTRHGVPLLPSREGEVITLEHVRRLMDEDGI
jgi:hypothetical protein